MIDAAGCNITLKCQSDVTNLLLHSGGVCIYFWMGAPTSVPVEVSGVSDDVYGLFDTLLEPLTLIFQDLNLIIKDLLLGVVSMLGYW